MKTIPDYKNSRKPTVLFEFPKTDFDFDFDFGVSRDNFTFLQLGYSPKFALGKGVFNKISLPSDNNKTP